MKCQLCDGEGKDAVVEGVVTVLCKEHMLDLKMERVSAKWM